MSITIAFGRWGLPYLVSVGRWEWACYRETGPGSRLPPRWGVQRRPGGDDQLSELILHCGHTSHCFTRWPRRVPLQRQGAGPRS